ncbi:MAG: glycosyltransferase [Planctomycetes bacterium]|nr:glycosyltransferase [Planctomycetota bacterium]
MALRNVLIAAYHFPPMGGSGVQRVAKWGRYLPTHGLRPHILCAGHGHYSLSDSTLVSDLHPSTRIHRVIGCEPAGIAARVGALTGSPRFESAIAWRLNSVADTFPAFERESLWVPSAIRAARQICRESPMHAVITSGPPHATHLIGLHLRRRLGLPWIADLRDALLDNWDRGDSRIESTFLALLERRIVRFADRIVVTCPEVAESMAARHAISPDRFEYFPNGYDPADAPPHAPRNTYDRLIVAHVGALYGDQTIAPVLEALATLIAVDPSLRDRIELRIVGTLSASQRASLCPEWRLLLTETGYLPHADAIRAMRDADALLLMTPSNGRGRFCIPAKTFEYLAFGGHILAIVHAGTELQRLLHRAGNATVVPSHSPVDIAAALQSQIARHRDGSLSARRDRAALTEYHRERQAQRLAELIDRVVAPAHPRLWIPRTAASTTRLGEEDAA